MTRPYVSPLPSLRLKRALLVLPILSTLAGCVVDPEDSRVQSSTNNDRVGFSGVKKNMPEYIEDVDLIAELSDGLLTSEYIPDEDERFNNYIATKSTNKAYPQRTPTEKILAQDPKTPYTGNPCEPYWRIVRYIGFGDISAERCNSYRQQKLVKAMYLFEDHYSSNQDAGARRRNQIQGRLLVAADQRCSVYLNFLQTQQSDGKYALGLGSVITGGLGAIFTEAAVTRPLAGASSIFSGVRAEFENQYFINQATYTIGDAIKQRRQRLLEDIYANSGRSQKVLRETIEGLALAKAQLDKAKEAKVIAQKDFDDATKKEDIADKKIALDTAEKNLEVAQERVNALHAKLAPSYVDKLTDLENDLRTAKDNLKNAQQAYDAATKNGGTASQEIATALKNAKGALKEAQNALDSTPPALYIPSLSQYPVYDAISDALKYHAACTVTSGFAEINEALKNSKSPGLDAMKETLNGIKEIQNKVKDIAADGNLPK